MSQLCLNEIDSQSESDTLRILNSPALGSEVTALWLYDRILSNLSLKPETLRTVQVSNTSLSFLHLCGRSVGLHPCSAFISLETFDLRDNALKVIQRMDLPKVKSIWLAGKIVKKKHASNIDLMKTFWNVLYE